MATDTAATPPALRTAPDPTRHVWQVPTFLLGAVVFVAAWQGWLPLGTPDPAGDFARDLLGLRAAYEKVTPDRDELKDLLARVAGGVDSFPEQGPMARFVLGSGYSRLAELSPSPDEARTNWALAKQHFDLVRPDQLGDPTDGPKLSFRAAKTRVAVGLPPNTPPGELKLHINLLGNVPFGEEAGDAGRLQAELALRLSPPDLNTAREGLTRYVTATGIATPASSLARAKLQLADIHYRRKEVTQARKWLEMIGSDAPPDVAGPARAKLALVKMAEEDWAGASKDWEAVRGTPGAPPALRASAVYNLAKCKLSMKEYGTAAALFADAAKGGGPEAQAAAVQLADLNLKGTEPARHVAAVDLLAAAVKGVTSPAGFVNPEVPVGEVVRVFELAVSVLLTDEAYDAAVRAADAYAVVAAGGRDREKRAEALAAWAASLQKSSGDFKPKAAAAAAEYEALVGLHPEETIKADLARRSAAMYKLGGDPARAVAVLQAATRLPKLNEAAAGAVWADLADSLLAAHRPDEAGKAFNEAMASAGPVSTAVRFRLARQFTDTRHPGLVPIGRGLFEQIAKQETVGPEERENHEKALRELAHEYIRANNYPEAEGWLRKQLALYPTGAEASLGRLLLGVCLIQRASAPPAPGVDPASTAAAAVKLREEAVKVFKQVVAEADARHKAEGKLAERDAWLRLQASLRVLQTYQQMAKPNDLLFEARDLLARHRGTVEELIILSLVYHAFRQKNETGLALQTRDQMKELFDRLPPAAFTRQDGEYSRTYWERVWFAPDPK